MLWSQILHKSLHSLELRLDPSCLILIPSPSLARPPSYFHCCSHLTPVPFPSHAIFILPPIPLCIPTSIHIPTNHLHLHPYRIPTPMQSPSSPRSPSPPGPHCPPSPPTSPLYTPQLYPFPLPTPLSSPSLPPRPTPLPPSQARRYK